jgi:pimeloyl-ACP methyl ester carboxylesterase
MPFDTGYAQRSKPGGGRSRWAGLAGREQGDAYTASHSFVFLHGLTFDRRMWDTVLDALPPDQRAIAFDLPGHGSSPSRDRHNLEAVVEAIHEAVIEADVERPVLVGHSIGAVLASMYAARYPAAAVVNVDSPVRIEPFVRLVQSLAPQLTGDGFDEAWGKFRASMHIERVPARGRELLEGGSRVSQELVLSYWADLLERSVEELASWVEEELMQAQEAALPYLAIFGNPLNGVEVAWLRSRHPLAEIVVWPVGHHFPHLAQPASFASLLSDFATDGSMAWR